MRKRSSNSAGAIYLDRDARIAELRAMARRAADTIPSIRRILLFGSTVSGVPTPRSDADLLVELAESPLSRPADRIPEVLRAMSPLACPVDLFVYTSEEIAHGLRESPVIRTALADGRDLLLEW